MAKGFVCLIVVVDCSQLQEVFAATVAVTLEVCHAVAVRQEAFNRQGQSEMVNTDHGSQCAAQEFVHAVKGRGYLQHGRARSLGGPWGRRAIVAIGEIRAGVGACS
jgi:hypothetical protein